jgi:hypothetical protein
VDVQHVQADGLCVKRTTDGLHVACAEAGNVELFISTDDKLVKRAKRVSEQLCVRVENPLGWIV